MPVRICANFFANKQISISEDGKAKSIAGVETQQQEKYGLATEVVGLSFPQIPTQFSNCNCTARLTRLSIDDILNELKAIRDRIAELREILASEKKLKAVIVAELREILKDYGDERRTQIVDRVEEIEARRPDQRRRNGHYGESFGIHQAHFGGCVSPPSHAVAKAESAHARARRISSSTCSLLRRTVTFCSSRRRAAWIG